MIRKAVADDLNGINLIRSQVRWYEVVSDIVFESEKNVAFVEIDNNQISGYFSLHSTISFQNDEEAELEVFVHPQYQRRGIGTKLINSAEQYSSDCTKLKRLIAKVLLDNKASIKMLEKAGFRVSDKDKKGVMLAKDIKR